MRITQKMLFDVAGQISELSKGNILVAIEKEANNLYMISWMRSYSGGSKSRRMKFKGNKQQVYGYLQGILDMIKGYLHGIRIKDIA